MRILSEVVRESRGCERKLVINFRGRFGNASGQQVDPAVGTEPASAVVPVEDAVPAPDAVVAAVLVERVDLRLHGVSLEDRRVAGAEALDDLAVRLAVLEQHPAAVEGRHDDGGAGGREDEAGVVEGAGEHGRIVPDSLPKSRG